MLYDSILHQCLKAGFSPKNRTGSLHTADRNEFCGPWRWRGTYSRKYGECPIAWCSLPEAGKSEYGGEYADVVDKEQNPALPGFVNQCRSIRDKLHAPQAERINN